MRQPIALDERGLKRAGYIKPSSADNRWCNPMPADQAERTMMELGSKALLTKIWQRHPRVLMVAQAHGRQVVRP